VFILYAGQSMQTFNFRHKYRAVAVAATLVSTNGAVLAEDAVAGGLHVHVVGMQNNAGQVVGNLFREGDNIFGVPLVKARQPVVDKQANITFSSLAAGRYALIVFHDVNGNNDLDHNLLGLPAEPLGYSNGFELTLLSGVPSSQKLAFTFDAATAPLQIKVR
jgi:uncharacterized protein (DUF2141 family)